MKKFLLLFFSFAAIVSNAQEIIMHTGYLSLCSGIFYDSGGATGSYQNSEKDTLVLCSCTPGTQISIEFTEFQIEQGFEYLRIYNGTNVNGSLLAVGTGTSLLYQKITSIGGGCLTITFSSDASQSMSGWIANVSCTLPCQQFTININSVSAPIYSGDTIRVCQNQSVYFSASGIYQNNNLNYSQSDTNTLFVWNFGDNSPVFSGIGLSSLTHSFLNSGRYITKITAIDFNDCNSTNYDERIMYVATSPTFFGTSSLQDTICLGDTINLNGIVSSIPWVDQQIANISDTTHIQDGFNVETLINLEINHFTSNDTVTNLNDLESILINMEHSYLGDLEMFISCPNGQIINLLGFYNYTCTTCTLPYPNYPQFPGYVHLGEPCDINPATSPGVGYDYYWNSSATETLPSIADSTTYTYVDFEGNLIIDHPYIPSDTFATETPFSSLIGCPLNGIWTLHIKDHLASDDGYIYYWALNFNSSIILPPATIENTYSSDEYLWVGDGVQNESNGLAYAIPTVSGSSGFTFSVIDDYGCTYDTILNVFINSINSLACGGTTINQNNSKDDVAKLYYQNETNRIYFFKEYENCRRIEIFNTLGCKVFQSNIEDNSEYVELKERIPQNIYVVRLTTDKNRFFTQKLLID